MQKYATALEDYWRIANPYVIPNERGDNAV
jgi:hypothetical protein